MEGSGSFSEFCSLGASLIASDAAPLLCRSPVLGDIGRCQAYRSGDGSRATDYTALHRLVANAGALLYRDMVGSRKEIVPGLDGDQLQGGIRA